MSPTAYYNENHPFAAEMLRTLIAEGELPYGHVDERSIVDVTPGDLDGFDQAHFFAGIGGWPLALNLADWPDVPVWTGSCPCQPFSSGGKNEGTADPRHLWPAWFRLIEACRPRVIFGEQVANAIRHGWMDAVQADLAAQGYASGFVVLGAHSVGAPHIRQRLFFVADSDRDGTEQYGRELPRHEGQHEERTTHGGDTPEPGRSVCDVADPDRARQWARRADETSDRRDAPRVEPSGLCDADRRECAARSVADPDGERADGHAGEDDGTGHEAGAELHLRREAVWSSPEWIFCRDGKYRPTQPGILPLVARVPRGVVPRCNLGEPGAVNSTSEARAQRVKGYGNAIVPQVAAAFIRGYLTGGIKAIVPQGAPLFVRQYLEDTNA